MRIELIEEFVVLARTLNYHVAAEELYITQPTLTKHMQDLEKTLGVTLLARDSHGTELTEAGRTIAKKAAYLISVYRDMVGSATCKRTEHLTVAVPLRYERFGRLAAATRQEATRRTPNVSCSVRDFPLTQTPSQLLSNECDLVLNVYLPEYESAEIATKKLCRVDLNAWVSNEGKFADISSVSLAELEPMVFRPVTARESDPWTSFVSRTFANRGVNLTVGDPIDDQYQLGPIDFGLVFGGSPNPTLGFNAKSVSLLDHLQVDVAVYFNSNRDDTALEEFINCLTSVAPSCFDQPA